MLRDQAVDAGRHASGGIDFVEKETLASFYVTFWLMFAVGAQQSYVQEMGTLIARGLPCLK
ncbi:hypothetical protein [Actinomadura bangladeshensis]|uniref:Uncharacterized protein n=2 Tax=Actinomadura bangladeshensis TaxID=453573 RepID=A0A4R4N5X8_9ACTN|nr:hypothetical protein [Actinomadura bangladeshensis]TDC02613.1 hypothetical protein E1284_39315 [Actinomadura bangladeshensis]